MSASWATCTGVYSCVSLIGQMKQEHENGEIVSSWGWLKFPTTSVHIRRESGWINEMENLETGSREWRPIVGNLTQVDFLMLNQTLQYSVSELISHLWSSWLKKKNRWKISAHVSLQTWVSIKKTHFEDYLFYEVLNFSISFSCTACSSIQPVWLLGWLRVRSEVTWAERNERWMTGRSPTPSPHVPPKNSDLSCPPWVFAHCRH